MLHRNRATPPPPAAEAESQPQDDVAVGRIGWIQHDLTMPSSLETRDVTRALRAAGYQVSMTPPASLTDHWHVAVREQVPGGVLAGRTLLEAAERMRRFAHEYQGEYLGSAPVAE